MWWIMWHLDEHTASKILNLLVEQMSTYTTHVCYTTGSMSSYEGFKEIRANNVARIICFAAFTWLSY